MSHSFLCSRLTPSLLKRELVDPQVRGNLVSEKNCSNFCVAVLFLKRLISLNAITLPQD